MARVSEKALEELAKRSYRASRRFLDALKASRKKSKRKETDEDDNEDEDPEDEDDGWG